MIFKIPKEGERNNTLFEIAVTIFSSNLSNKDSLDLINLILSIKEFDSIPMIERKIILNSALNKANAKNTHK